MFYSLDFNCLNVGNVLIPSKCHFFRKNKITTPHFFHLPSSFSCAIQQRLIQCRKRFLVIKKLCNGKGSFQQCRHLRAPKTPNTLPKRRVNHLHEALETLLLGSNSLQVKSGIICSARLVVFIIKFSTPLVQYSWCFKCFNHFIYHVGK
jgi:hypothetical protein